MGDLLSIALKRISTIQFENIDDKIKESHHVLIREYLRRINVFLDNLGIGVDEYPIFSVSKTLGKSSNINIFKICPKLDKINNLYIQVICYCYLEISQLADEGVDEAMDYIDLYEPMIKFFERRGVFWIRQGELIVGKSVYPLSYWRHLEIQPSDISDDLLSEMDNRSK
ncbi:hypothetical protein LAV73_21860 [Lysinibacillus xylanilyticus]|uniref:hypothetical protein n=1 Tax=Lysinibacillus xylanilyticus TaxID=582475 RepID=UPI002B24CF40|nr:hypothetical protein [Lysinibacillus xylanilyticus]MEB2282577.1 hypothetical protein [Lysinibacillus xylanilyticus]